MKTAAANFTNAARKAVRRGIAAINAHFQNDNWVDEIDFDKLNMNYSDRCICGQLGLSMHKNGIYGAGANKFDDLSSELGFYSGYIQFANMVKENKNFKTDYRDQVGKGSVATQMLQRVWVQEITKLRQVREAVKPYTVTVLSANQVVTSVVTVQ